jgi:flagellar biosynthesis protein FlhA
MQLTSAFQSIDKSKLKNIAGGMGAPIVVLAIMGMVILPMPPMLLDVLFSFNIALSLVIILVSVLTKRFAFSAQRGLYANCTIEWT